MTDYEREYQRCASACGEPFAEFVEFFCSRPGCLSVLDLGCGQGRDALVAARHGHSVHGVDIAASGLAQLRAQAKTEGLNVRCDAQDIEGFCADQLYDVIVLDRVLHMLPSEEKRRTMLSRAQGWVAPRGYVLVADTKKNRALIRSCFSDDAWYTILGKQDFFFAQRITTTHIAS